MEIPFPDDEYDQYAAEQAAKEREQQAALAAEQAAAVAAARALQGPADLERLDISRLLFKLTIDDKGKSKQPPDRQLQQCFEAMSALKEQVRQKLRKAATGEGRASRASSASSRAMDRVTGGQHSRVLVGADAKDFHELLVRVEGGLSLAVDPLTLAAMHTRHSRNDIHHRLIQMGKSESVDRQTAAFIQEQFSGAPVGGKRRGSIVSSKASKSQAPAPLSADQTGTIPARNRESSGGAIRSFEGSAGGRSGASTPATGSLQRTPEADTHPGTLPGALPGAVMSAAGGGEGFNDAACGVIDVSPGVSRSRWSTESGRKAAVGEGPGSQSRGNREASRSSAGMGALSGAVAALEPARVGDAAEGRDLLLGIEAARVYSSDGSEESDDDGAGGGGGGRRRSKAASDMERLVHAASFVNISKHSSMQPQAVGAAAGMGESAASLRGSAASPGVGSAKGSKGSMRASRQSMGSQGSNRPKIMVRSLSGTNEATAILVSSPEQRSATVRHLLHQASSQLQQVEEEQGEGEEDEDDDGDGDEDGDGEGARTRTGKSLWGRTRSKSADKDNVALDAGIKPVLTRKGSKSSMQVMGYDGLLNGLPSGVSERSRAKAGQHLELLGSYDFDPIGLDRHTHGCAVAIVAPILLRAAGYLRAGEQPDPMMCVRVAGMDGSGQSPAVGASSALDRFPALDGNKMPRFLQAVLRGYRRGRNPFHNDVHAVDVMHTVFVMLQSPLLFEVFSAEQRLAMVLGALLHDLGHPGLTNNFLVATAHPLAVRYNDQSVLENMHISEAFRLMAAPSRNVLWKLEGAEYQSTRRAMIECVLATDMARHFQMMEVFETEVVASAESALRRAIREGTRRTGRAMAAMVPGLKRRGTEMQLKSLLAKGQVGQGSTSSSARSLHELAQGGKPGPGGGLQRGGIGSGSGLDRKVGSFVSVRHLRQSIQASGRAGAGKLSDAGGTGAGVTRVMQGATSHRSVGTASSHLRGADSYATLRSTASTQLAIAGRRQWYGADEKAVAAALRAHSLHLCKALVHAADISNPTKPRDIALAWARRCMDEFYQQGDLERERGMAISPNFDREATHEARCQLGFIGFIIEPTFRGIRKVLPHVSEDLQFSLEGNKIMYESRAAAGHATLPRAGQGTRRRASSQSSTGSYERLWRREDRERQHRDGGRQSPTTGRDHALTGAIASMDDAIIAGDEEVAGLLGIPRDIIDSSDDDKEPEGSPGVKARQEPAEGPALTDFGRKVSRRRRHDSPTLRPLSAKASLAGGSSCPSGSASAESSSPRGKSRSHSSSSSSNSSRSMVKKQGIEQTAAVAARNGGSTGPCENGSDDDEKDDMPVLSLSASCKPGPSAGTNKGSVGKKAPSGPDEQPSSGPLSSKGSKQSLLGSESVHTFTDTDVQM